MHHPDPGRPTAPEAASTFWSAGRSGRRQTTRSAPVNEPPEHAAFPSVKPAAASVRAPCSYPPGTDLCAAGQTIPHSVPGSASICGVLHTGRPLARRRQFRRAAAETLVHCRLLEPTRRKPASAAVQIGEERSQARIVRARSSFSIWSICDKNERSTSTEDRMADFLHRPADTPPGQELRLGAVVTGPQGQRCVSLHRSW
jgi:hypothetical protein